MNEDEA